MKQFKPPSENYGIYEERPVYGYDDCFPSVEPCKFPGKDWQVPDHGEVCYLPFDVIVSENRLIFKVKSEILPLELKREMIFQSDTLIWDIEVINKGETKLPFQHVIHPLMPLSSVKNMELPRFGSVLDAIMGKTLEIGKPSDVAKFLLDRKVGTANMLFLQKIEDNSLSLLFKNGMRLEMIYSKSLFPSIGIWWNNWGYPDEEGCRRNECAFEPIPGLTSKLSEAFEQGKCLFVSAGQQLQWQIRWHMSAK
jgi:hypothetical protein